MPEKWREYIDYDFTDWNRYINAERGNLYRANQIKQDEKRYIGFTIKKKYEGKYPVTLTVRPYFKDKRRDLDNYRLKGLIDGLVSAGVIKNDNLNCIDKIIVEPIFEDRRGVIVEIERSAMTLREYIEESESDYIKIGSDKGGGGFIYCGRTDEAIEELKDFDDEELEHIADLIIIDKKRLEFLSDEKEIEYFIKRETEVFRKEKAEKRKNCKYGKIKTEEELIPYLRKKREKEKATRFRHLEKMREILQGYTDLMSRRIVEKYPSMINDDEIIVIYDGYESRGYWDRSEYERKKNVCEDNY